MKCSLVAVHFARGGSEFAENPVMIPIDLSFEKILSINNRKISFTLISKNQNRVASCHVIFSKEFKKILFRRKLISNKPHLFIVNPLKFLRK